VLAHEPAFAENAFETSARYTAQMLIRQLDSFGTGLLTSPNRRPKVSISNKYEEKEYYLSPFLGSQPLPLSQTQETCDQAFRRGQETRAEQS
jgi:hypothetical protein